MMVWFEAESYGSFGAVTNVAVAEPLPGVRVYVHVPSGVVRFRQEALPSEKIPLFPVVQAVKLLLPVL